MKRNKNVAPYIFVTPYLILFTLFFLFTIAYAIYVSLFVERGGMRTFVGLRNYMQAFGDTSYWDGFARVVKFAAIYVIALEIIAVALSLMLDTAYAKFKSFFQLTYFLPYAVPGVIAAVMWGFLYSPKLNTLLNSLREVFGSNTFELLKSDTIIYGILNISIWEWTGYNVVIFHANLTSISPELYEAAKIDGCNEFQTAIRIKLPLLKSTVSMTMLLTIIGAFQLFNEPLMLSYMASVPAAFTPNLYIYRMAFSYSNFPYSSALSIILTLVTILVSVIFLRFTANEKNISTKGGRKG